MIQNQNELQHLHTTSLQSPQPEVNIHLAKSTNSQLHCDSSHTKLQKEEEFRNNNQKEKNGEKAIKIKILDYNI